MKWSRLYASLLFAFAVPFLIGGVVLLVVASDAMPTEPHHGQALDGLDGLGRFYALVAGGGGLIALAIGAFLLWYALAQRREAK